MCMGFSLKVQLHLFIFISSTIVVHVQVTNGCIGLIVAEVPITRVRKGAAPGITSSKVYSTYVNS